MVENVKKNGGWEEVAERMRSIRDQSLALVRPPVSTIEDDTTLNVTGIPSQILSSKEISITESTPEQLLLALTSGSLSSVEVTNAFLRRAVIAQKLTNCVTELLPSSALQRAQFLDDYYSNHKKPIGPLHGIPISVKEHISMKGRDVNAGFIGWVGQIADEDAHILKILWEAGAVFYARTTQPQTLMHLETSSNLYGETVNPFNRKLTCGGSSGGEGALLGMRGSCLGIGSDIGGSIRSPAANNGLYGLRPTSYRLPTEGWVATMGGQEQIIPVIGPLSTSLEGIKLFMKTLIDAKPWLIEPSLLPIPWSYDQNWLSLDNGKTKIKIGVMYDDDVVKPHPPVIRALNELVLKFRDIEGIDVVDWRPYKHDKAWEIIASLYFCDGAKQEIEAIESSGEPYRPLSRFILQENPFIKNHSVSDVWNLTMQREQYRVDYAKLWNERDVDVILCPVGPGAAPPLNNAKYWGYTSQWNLLDYPALVFPVTKVNPDIDRIDESYVPRNEKDQFNYDLYDPQVYQDAPVNLQLVGRRYEDEKVIQVLEYISSKFTLPFSN